MTINLINFIKKLFKISPLSIRRNSRLGNFNKIGHFVRLTNVTIGDYTYVANAAALTNCTVGSFSSIGPEAFIGLGIHPSSKFISTHPVFYSPAWDRMGLRAANFEESSGIEIGSDVWVGARAIIMDGVRVGDGAIVAAGAVVTADVPSYAIFAGVPARLIRFRFSEEEIVMLTRLKWWDRPYSWIKANKNYLVDVRNLKKLF
jgi:acetyltransferase-like isoleucine patch superfamily enzyme